MNFYCSEWCVYDAWNGQLIAEPYDIEEQTNCAYCDGQLLALFTYFTTDLDLSQLTKEEKNDFAR